MTSLSGNTNYYVWVRSNCGGAGISEWSVLPGVLTTECDPIPAPTASPETFTTYLPSVCWKEAQGVLGAPTTFTSTISSSWTGDDFANITSPVNDAANLSISGTLADEWLITPSYDLGTGGNLQLEFDLALTGNGNTNAASLDVDDKFIVLISTDNGATWSSANILRQWNNSTPISNTGEHIVINLSAYTGVVKFAFYGESTITNTTIEVFVDNVEIKTIPSCASPASVTISNVTNNSATADWTAPVPAPTSYDLYFSTSNTDPTSGTTPTATGLTATTYNLTGLTGNTSYYVWVRSNCSGTLSSWTSLAAQFTTECDVVSTFTENFDGVTAPALPNCWEKVGTSGSVQTQTTGNNTPPNTLYIYSSTTSNIAMVSMPKINNLGAGTHWLKFDIRANFTANGIIEIGYLTTPGDQSSFVLIDTVKAGSTTTYSERTVMPGVISTSSQLLAFRHTGSPANSILIDNVRWEAMPACTGAVGGTATASAITYCDSGTPTITASGFSIGAISSYQWQSSSDNTTWTDIPGATDPSGFVPASALTATTYYRLKVTCTSGTATDYSNTVTITINPRPTVTVSAASNNICGGGSGTTLTASGANTYTWSPTTGLTPTTGAVVTANPTSNTNYTVTGTETATGCTNTATVAITVAPTINL
ncbi:MAG TPA: fibronectin type III domain-containing protein, partial [Chitinophagaceae bacterium]